MSETKTPQPVDLRKLILEAEDGDSEIVEVPQWGGAKVEIRSMSGRDRARMLKQSMIGDEIDLESLYPHLIVACAHHPDTGEKLFEASDLEALNSKSAGAIERLAQAAMRLSGLDTRAVDRAGNSS